MSWIDTVPYADASGSLREAYDRVRGADGQVDNILQAHALRPHTLAGHMALYKSVLHHPRNTLPKWLLEAVGVYVSMLNGCEYCVRHHSAGLRRELADEERARSLLAALASGRPEEGVGARERAVLRYAERLTRDPAAVDEALIAAMRAQGLDDGQILEVNQVASYFAYANRTVLGLGVSTAGEVLGLAPADSEDPDDWRHG